jgi:hypothetical protein
MRNFKYILMFFLSMALLNSCFEDTTDLDMNGQGPNTVTFERVNANLTCTANGSEYDFQSKIKVVGPTLTDLSSDLSVTLSANEAKSTAIEGVHYRLDKEIALSADNNYLGLMDIVLTSEGNSPPAEGTPEFEEYEAPLLYLDIAVEGDSKVVGSGKGGVFTLNFTAPNPYAGDYVSHVIYRHPSAGEYPDNISSEDDYDKTLSPITGRKCETGFAVWPTTDICWITVNLDNSINFEVWDGWADEVKLGDPNDPSKVSYFDPETGVIYLYYNYCRADGCRIFWETFTPQF